MPSAAGGLTGLVIVVAVIGAIDEGAESMAAAALWVMAVAVIGGLLVWWFTIRPRIEIVDGFVIVRNPWRVRRLPLESISSLDAGYWGVEIRADASDRPASVTAWAVQKSNLAIWMKRSTRADRVAAAIREAAARSRGCNSGPSVGPGSPGLVFPPLGGI